jgi:membrane protein
MRTAVFFGAHVQSPCPAGGEMEKAGNVQPHKNSSRMRDLLKHPKEIWLLIRDSGAAWLDDSAASMGAAISYYTIFSIAPLLLIVIAVAGLVLGQEAASGQIFAQLQGLLGDDGAAAIEGMVQNASLSGKSFWATTVGVITLVIGATTVFGELQSALDRIWESPAAAKTEGIWNLLRTRVLSFGMILAIGFLLLVSLVVSAGLAALGSWWAPMLAGWEILLHVINFIISLSVVTALFALIYKFLPRARIGWHDVWIGAGATALLFTLGKFLIGLYIGKSSVASGFGAAGSLVIVLVWVYYSAQIFLLGAEFTWVYAFRHGSRRGEKQAGAAGQQRAAPSKAKEAADDDSSVRAGPADWPSQTAADVWSSRRTSSKRGIWRAGAAVAVGGAVGWALGKMTRPAAPSISPGRPARWRSWA